MRPSALVVIAGTSTSLALPLVPMVRGTTNDAALKFVEFKAKTTIGEHYGDSDRALKEAVVCCRRKRPKFSWLRNGWRKLRGIDDGGAAEEKRARSKGVKMMQVA